jgi:hypothetical protein
LPVQPKRSDKSVALPLDPQTFTPLLELRCPIARTHPLLLPHDQFIIAEFTSGGDEQLLKLVFATHEVLIRGHHLRRIETTIQRMELSFIATLPSSQRSLTAEGQPIVLEIVVTVVPIPGVGGFR